MNVPDCMEWLSLITMIIESFLGKVFTYVHRHAEACICSSFLISRENSVLSCIELG